MKEQTSKRQQKRSACHTVQRRNAAVVFLTALLTLAVVLAACGSPPAAPLEVTVQAALPTPTLEPTFTPLPPPTNTQQPLPTATLVKPTLTAIPQSLLSGRIFDQDTNQPIAGAKVSAGLYAATADADGRYTLTGLPPGQYVLSVTHPDYDPGLSSIFTLAAGQEQSLDLALYAPDTSPYPKDPMLTNPLDPNGAPTAKDAERLAREQGLTGKVVRVEEMRLTGQYLVNYKVGDEVRAAVAELNHDVWELTDETGRAWWIIKVCSNLASPLPPEGGIATPQPRPLPPMAEVVADGLIVRECASEECAEVGTVERGARIEVVGCTADGSWCQVEMPGGESGWCTGASLQQLAVAEAIQAIEAMLPTATPGVVTAEGKIAFSSNRDGNYEIYVMNTDGSGLIRLTNHPANDYVPTWSPDGRQIAFARDDYWDIYKMNADGSGLTRLTDYPGYYRSPAWSPDGQQIAFTSNRDGNWEIYLMNADGSDPRRLTHHPASDLAPTWSPNSHQIAFASDRDVPNPQDCGGIGQYPCSQEIYVINTDGSGLTCLTNHPAHDWFPAWAPNGRQIAFVSNRDGNDEIYVMNADGSNQIRLTNHSNMDYGPAWSPDSRQIAFESWRDDNAEIYVINADGSSLTRLTNHQARDMTPAWSP